MKMVVLGNIQKDFNFVKTIRHDLSSADLILLTGNITSQGGLEEAKNIIEPLKMINPNILSVMGKKDDKEVLDYLESENLSIHGKGRIYGEIGIFGLGGGSISLFKNNIEFSGKELTYYLSEGYKIIKDCKTIILVSHTPPFNTKLDKIANGDHVGSRAIRSFIFKYPPNMLVSSSIHNGAIIDRYGTTMLATSGSLSLKQYLLIDLVESNQIKIMDKSN